MALKVRIPVSSPPVAVKPLPAPKKKVTLPLREPSVLGDSDELEFLDPEEGEILSGQVIPAPKPLAPLLPKNPLKLLPSPGGKLKGLPVVKSASALAEAQTQAAHAAAREPKEGQTIPPLECSTCTVGVQCPKFNEGDICGYESSFSSFDIRSATGIIQAMEMMLVQNLKRLQLMYLFEQVQSGGLVDPNITRLSSEVQGQMRNLLELKRQTQTITVETTGPAVGGVLSRMFGAPTNAPSSLELHPEEAESKVVVRMTRSQKNREAEED